MNSRAKMFKFLLIYFLSLIQNISSKTMKIFKFSLLKFENYVEYYAMKCYNQEYSFRYESLFMHFLLFYIAFHRLLFVLFGESLNLYDSFAFYNHHIMIFHSRDQDVLSVFIFFVVSLIIRVLILNPDKYLLEVFMRIYFEKSIRYGKYNGSFDFSKYFKIKSSWKNFKFINFVISTSFAVASMLEILLWFYMTRKLYLYCNENIFENKIFLILKFAIFSGLYHSGFHLIGKCSNYNSSFFLFSLYFIKVSFEILKLKFENLSTNILNLRKDYGNGLSIFFRINSVLGIVLLYIIFFGTPVHAYLVIQIIIGENYSNIFSIASVFILTIYLFYVQFCFSRVSLSINRLTKVIHSRLAQTALDKRTTKMSILRTKFSLSAFITIINKGYWFTYSKYGSITFISFQKFLFIYLKIMFMLYKSMDYIQHLRDEHK